MSNLQIKLVNGDLENHVAKNSVKLHVTFNTDR